MQMKTMMRCHLTPGRIVIIKKKKKKSKFWQECGEKEILKKL
jgi:hypothetical protein